MRGQILLVFALVASMPVLAQSSQDSYETAEPENPLQQVRMMLPPPLSGAAYATIVGAEQQSNFLKTGVTVGGGYVRNLLPGVGGQNVNEATYLIQPTLALDRTTSRLRSTLTYNPAFAWYQVPNTVSTADHNLQADMQWRLAKYVSFRATESLQKTSTGFGQTTASFAPTVGGSTQYAPTDVAAIYEPQISNQTIAGMTWQYGRNDMVAGSGWFSMLHFTNPAQTGGFYNTNAEGGSGSWAHRFGPQQYAGGMYQYATAQARPATATETGKSDTTTHSLLAFYTVYLTPRLSLSVQGGEQHYILSEPSLANYQSWSPTVDTSLGWQGDHTTFAVSYSRTVSAEQGAIGAYLANRAAFSGQWQITRTWTAGLGGSYGMTSDRARSTFTNTFGSGHAISGVADLTHNLSQFLQVSCNYARIHQRYSGIPSVAANPDSDRVLVSLSYLLFRPLGK